MQPRQHLRAVFLFDLTFQRYETLRPGTTLS